MNTFFAKPAYLLMLWIVPVLPALFYIVSRARERKLNAFISPSMRNKLYPLRNGLRGWAQTLAVTAGLAGLILASAEPGGKSSGTETFVEHSGDVVILLDVSVSMLTRDIHPNRLERAKSDLIDMVSRLNGARCSVVTFRGQPVTVCPPTSDYHYVRDSILNADINSSMPGPTDIGGAIDHGLNILKKKNSESGIILLVSDGEDLADNIDPAIKRASSENVSIMVMETGTIAGGQVPDPSMPDKPLTHNGTAVTSRSRPGLLNKIARSTGGNVMRPGESIRKIFTAYHDNTDEKINSSDSITFRIFLLPSLICLIISMFLSEGRVITRSKHALTFVLLASSSLLVLPPRPAMAETEKHLSRDPDEAFRQTVILFNSENYEDALTELKQLILSDPDSDDTATLNSRAAMCVFLLDYEPDPEIRHELFEYALSAMTKILKNDPDNFPARNNLFAARQRYNAVKKDYLAARKGKDDASSSIDDILDEILLSNRKALETLKSAITSETEEKIRLSETASDIFSNNAYRFIALGKRIKIGSQEEINISAEQMLLCARMAEDLDPGAIDVTSVSKDIVYKYWKNFANQKMLSREALNRQDNLFQTTMVENPRISEIEREHTEVMSLTRLIAERSDPLSPEFREEKNIVKMAEEALIHQEQALKHIRRGKISKARAFMRKSREILLNITGKTDDISDNEKKNQNTPDTNNTDGNKGGKPENDISSSVIKGTNNVSSSAQRVIQRVLERENEYRSEKRKRNIRYGTTDLEMDW